MFIPIGNKIKALRQKQKICQQDLCCGILSRTILSKIENNKMLPSIPQLEHISKTLNVPITYFFNDDELAADIQVKTLHDRTIEIEDLFKNKKYLTIVEAYEQGKCKLNEDCTLCYYVGISYYYINLYNKSLVFLRKFITSYKHSSESYKYRNVEYFATAHNILSIIMLNNSNFKKALSYLNEALNIIKLYRNYDTKIYSIIISNIGSIYCKIHQYEKVIAVLEPFLENKDDMVYLFAVSSIHLSLNIAYFELSNYEASLNHVKNAIWLFKYIGKNFDANECYLNYINVLRFTYKFDEAMNLINELKSENDTDDKLINLLMIEEMALYFNLGKFETALTLSRDVKLKNLRKRSKMDYYFIIGHALFLKGDLITSYTYLNKCIKYFRNKKFYLDLSLIYDDLHIIFNDESYKTLSENYKEMLYTKNICIF